MEAGSRANSIDPRGRQRVDGQIVYWGVPDVVCRKNWAGSGGGRNLSHDDDGSEKSKTNGLEGHVMWNPSGLASVATASKS